MQEILQEGSIDKLISVKTKETESKKELAIYLLTDNSDVKGVAYDEDSSKLKIYLSHAVV